MIISDSGAKRIENTDNWREIFDDHNGTVDALDLVAKDLAPVIKGNTCAAGAAAGDYVLLCGSTITGKDDGAYIAAKAIPANTAIDATYLGTALGGGIANSLNSKTEKAIVRQTYTKKLTIAAGSGIGVSADDLGVTVPSGYTVLAISGWYSSSPNITVYRRFAWNSSGNMIYFSNDGGSQFSDNISIIIVFIKNEFFSASF